MKPDKRLRYRFEYFAFLALAAAMRMLPLELASRWSGALWRLIAPRSRRHRRALNNLALAFPEKTPGEIEQIARGMWENLGRTFAEFFHIDRIFNSDRIEFESQETFDALRRSDGRAIACGLHLGNWEILTQSGLLLGWRPAGVYQKIANPFVDRYVSTLRAPYYPGGLMQKSPRTAVSLLRHAREGGCVALLADQREGRGVAAPFFGKPAPSNPFPALVARSVDAPLYVFRAKRLDGVRFSIRIAQVPVPQTDNRDADIEAATRNLQSTLEAMVRDAPDQWMWIHRRWG
ncbi:lysophospholipid acyltransferase family protein [Methylocapsa sp. S129]|uniref:lysophospholipid acyltransferase family protein n=1 Tax=Methylocapsa sp. S129 TaxID=1641869 RepID=UPI00131CDE98|nr:lauroyl acyltransferase [Methylocapsa sp. S129]